MSVPSVRLSTLVEMTVLQTAGLSHSEIRRSEVICTLPRLIAAYHVLHRLREPRHPPCALVHFLGRRFSSFKMKPQLILSAVSSLYCYNQEELSLLFEFHSTVSCVNMSKISMDLSGCPECPEWRMSGSNRWHPACNAGALPTEPVS